MSSASWPGYAALDARLRALARPSTRRVLEDLEAVIFADNRRGLLAGTDRDGNPMKSTVREGTPAGHWVSYRLPDGRLGRYYQAGRSGDRPGDGPGKPIVPHGDDSRAIKDLVTAHYESGPGEWTVFGAWENVVSERGVPFLPFHFRGEGRLPRRDLAGLRPDGFADAAAAVDAWGATLADGTGG